MSSIIILLKGEKREEVEGMILNGYWKCLNGVTDDF